MARTNASVSPGMKPSPPAVIAVAGDPTITEDGDTEVSVALTVNSRVFEMAPSGLCTEMSCLPERRASVAGKVASSRVAPQ